MSDDHDHHSFATPDPFGGRVSLHLAGSFRRSGTMQLDVDGRLVDFLPLPRKQWATLALLVQSVLKSSTIGSFFTSDQLATALERQNIIEWNDPQIAIRIMYRLRETLNRLSAANLLFPSDTTSTQGSPIQDNPTQGSPIQGSFATRLIRTWKVRGYRISLPASRLSLELYDED
ncbi:MAG: hypothetical protein U0935_16490 [Pirellulales bacterium]